MPIGIGVATTHHTDTRTDTRTENQGRGVAARSHYRAARRRGAFRGIASAWSSVVALMGVERGRASRVFPAAAAVHLETRRVGSCLEHGAFIVTEI